MKWTYTSNQGERTMLNEIVELNEQVIRTKLKELVRKSVEEILNGQKASKILGPDIIRVSC